MKRISRILLKTTLGLFVVLIVLPAMFNLVIRAFETPAERAAFDAKMAQQRTAEAGAAQKERGEQAKRDAAAAEAKHLKDRDHAEIDAYVTAKEFVTARLKAPSTAKFPGMFDQDEKQTVSLGNGRYRVHSWVDSQNSFGAMIRTHWTCELTTIDGRNFRLASFTTH